MGSLRKSSLALLFFLAMTSVATAGPLGVSSSGGRYFFEFSPSPADIAVMQPFDIKVRVRAGGPDGALICDARLIADLWMGQHGHGMTVAPKIIRRKSCEFVIQGMLMHMPGAWDLILGVEQGGATEKAYFSVYIW